MFLSGTKCQLLTLSCLLSASLFAKDVKTTMPRGLEKPLCFVENKGQVLDNQNHTRTDIQFKLATKGLNLFVGDAQLHYQFKKVEDRNHTPFITSYNMDVALLGANLHATPVVSEEIAYHENYFLAQTGKDGFTAHAYSKVTYKDVYPNIDWVLYVKDGNVEYDFVVRPGGNTNDIRVKYSGATALSLSKDGGIVANTPMGSITEKQPYSYETATGRKVNSKFVVHDNVVSFETGTYNGTLTIDPYLSFCTYLGGSGDDIIKSVKCSAASPYNIYVCGYTSSNSAFTTGGAYRTTYGGGTYDAFFGQYASGGALSYMTYYGGAGSDDAADLVVTTAGVIYFVGNTSSNAGIASGGGGTYSGGGDMYLACFNTAGTTRFFCRYIGGSAADVATSIGIDAGSNIFIGGKTQSTGMSTNGTTLSGSDDIYLGKFSNIGNRLWSTYYGGSNAEEIDAIAVDGSNNVITAGLTNSTSGIATTGAAQAVIGSSSASDGFLGKFSGASGAIIFGTYVGGGGTDACNGVTVDASGNIYTTGYTTSSDSIVYGSAYQSTYGGGTQDAFVQKYTNAGAVVWGTYLGGNSTDNGNAITVDRYGSIVTTGYTQSTSGLSTAGAYQTSNGGGFDIYVAKFTQNGQNLYTTYFGNSANEVANSISTDASTSSVVIAGSTTNSSGLATAGAAQTSYGGGTFDGLIARFSNDTIVLLRQGQFTDTLLCSSGTLIVHDTTLTNFQAGNVFTVQLSDASGSFASPTTIGTSTANSTGSINCTLSSVSPGTGYRIRIVASNPAFTSPDNGVNINIVSALPSPTVTGTALVCAGQTISLGVTATYPLTGYNWSGPAAFSSAVQNPVVTTSATTANAGTYTVTTTHNGCGALNTTFNVSVNTVIPPTPTDSSNNPVCTGSPIRLYANPGTTGTFSYYWTGPGGFTSTLQNPVIPAASAANVGSYYVIDTLSQCPSAVSAAVVVSILPLDTPTITIHVTPGDTVCKGTLVSFTSTTTHAGFSPTFQWLSNATTPIVGAIYDHYSTTYFSLGTAIRCVMSSSVGCPDKPADTSNIIYMTIIDNTPIITITPSPDSFVAPGGSVTFHAVVAGYNLLTGMWYVNNVATMDTTTSLTLSHITANDTVRYEVASSSLCASIGVSNIVVVRPTASVAGVASTAMNIEMLPNPNNGSFAIKGTIGSDNGTLNLQVTNAIGQVAYSGKTEVVNGLVNSSISLINVPAGMYLLHLNKEGASQVLRFIVE